LARGKQERENAAFLNLKVNTIFKKMLDEWDRFLASSDSTYFSNDKKDDWLNEHALEAMRRALPDPRSGNSRMNTSATQNHSLWLEFLGRIFRQAVQEQCPAGYASG
jgi:hypothetical protein